MRAHKTATPPVRKIFKALSIIIVSPRESLKRRQTSFCRRKAAF
jgi:hypothetical protein